MLTHLYLCIKIRNKCTGMSIIYISMHGYMYMSSEHFDKKKKKLYLSLKCFSYIKFHRNCYFPVKKILLLKRIAKNSK